MHNPYSEYAELARQLKLQHKTINGCICTEYQYIQGLKVSASTTNGTSGLGVYRGYRVYWSYNHTTQEFEVERDSRHA